MRSKAALLSAAAIAAVALAPLSATQERPTEKRPHQGDAAHQKDGVYRSPAFVEAPLGRTAVIKNADGHQLGTIADHRIDKASGAVTNVVVQIADKSVLVPFSRFHWNGEQRELTLPLTPEELASMPEYDAEKPDLERPKSPSERPGRGTNDDADPLGKARAMEASMREPRELGASQIANAKVMSMGEELGAIDALVLEPNHGAIAFVLVAQRGEDPLVVPWDALSWKGGTKEEPLQPMLPAMPKAIDEAPRLAGRDVKSLEKKEILEEIRNFWNQPGHKVGGAPEDEQPGIGRGAGRTRG